MFKILRFNRKSKVPDLTSNYVILVKTKEQYDDLMEYLEALGCLWGSMEKPTAKNFWGSYTNLCIWIERYTENKSYLGYEDLEFYQNNKQKKYSNYVFLTAEEFLKDASEYFEKRKRKKEELRLKHLDVDPYSEENWLVDESVNDGIIKLPSPYPSTNTISKWYNKYYDEIVDNDISFNIKDWDRHTNDYEIETIKKHITDIYFSEGYLFFVDGLNNIYQVEGKEIEILSKNEKVYNEEIWGNNLNERMSRISVDTCVANGERFNVGDMVFYNDNIRIRQTTPMKGRLTGQSSPIYLEFNLTPGNQYEIIDIEQGRDYYFNPKYRAWLFDDNNDFIWVPMYCIYKEHPRIITPEDPYGEEIWESYKVGNRVYYLSGFSILGKHAGYSRIIKTMKDGKGKIWYALEKEDDENLKIEWISDDDLSDNKEEAVEKCKKRRAEIVKWSRKRAEEKKKRLEMVKDIDPYGEEIWESYYRSINEKLLSEDFDIILIDNKEDCERIMKYAKEEGYKDWGISYDRLSKHREDGKFYLYLYKSLSITWSIDSADSEKHIWSVDEFLKEIDKDEIIWYDKGKFIKNKMNELFETEKTYDYQFVKKHTWMDPYIDFIYKFRSKDNILYFVTVSFNKMDNYLGVKFTDESGFTGTLKYLLKNGPFDKYYEMNKHDAINVLNTVVKICKDFVTEHTNLDIKGFKTWTFSQKRANVYKYILAKYFKGWNISSYMNNKKEYEIECKPI